MRQDIFFYFAAETKAKILHIFFSFFECFWYFFLVFSLHLQDEKNQIIITNVWLNLVSSFYFKRGNTQKKYIRRTKFLTKSERTNTWSSTLSLLYIYAIRMRKIIFKKYTNFPGIYFKQKKKHLINKSNHHFFGINN